MKYPVYLSSPPPLIVNVEASRFEVDARTIHWTIEWIFQEEKVKFEAGVKRGKVYVPKYNEEQLAAMAKKAETEEAVR